MRPPNGSTEPTESTSFLKDDAKKSIIGNGNGIVSGTGSKSGDEDPETGSVENADAEENPLFEGNEEMRRRMMWIFPATSIGVSSSFVSVGSFYQFG